MYPPWVPLLALLVVWAAPETPRTPQDSSNEVLKAQETELASVQVSDPARSLRSSLSPSVRQGARMSTDPKWLLLFLGTEKFPQNPHPLGEFSNLDVW